MINHVECNIQCLHPRQGDSPIIPGTTRIQAFLKRSNSVVDGNGGIPGRLTSSKSISRWKVGSMVGSKASTASHRFRPARICRAEMPRFIPSLSFLPPFRYLDGVQKWFASNEATLFPRDVPFLPVARVNIGRNRNLFRRKRIGSRKSECFHFAFRIW